MKVAFLLLTFISGHLWAQSKTEVTGQLQYYNAYVRHNYRMFGSERLKLSLYSHKQGPQFLQREFSQNIGLPVDLNFKHASTGFSLALEQNSDPTVPRLYKVNWYLSRKLSKKFGANFNFYTDRHERDKTFTYSNFNAALQYQVTPTLNFNIKSEAGKSINAAEYTINHVIGTTLAF